MSNSRIPPVPAGLQGDDLIAAVNDRLRRVTPTSPASTGNSQTATPTTTGSSVSGGSSSGSKTIGVSVTTISIEEVGPRTLAQTTTVQMMPTFSGSVRDGLPATVQVTVWASWDTGLDIYGVGIFSSPTNATATVNVSVNVYPSAAQAGLTNGATSNNFKLYALIGSNPISTGTPITLTQLLQQYPDAVASNAITLIANSAPSPTGSGSGSPPAGSPGSGTRTPTPPTQQANPRAVLVTGQRVPATETNIYAGTTSTGAPYWIVYVNIVTPGTADPATSTYALGIRWCDANGNQIDPGGSNSAGQANFIVGWQLVQSGIPNDGGNHPVQLIAGYPAPGVDAYMQFGIWACNASFFSDSQYSQVPPYTANPDTVLAQFWALGTALDPNYGLLHVGPPPGTMGGFGVNNTPGTTANPTGQVVQANPNPGHSLLQDWDLGLTPLGTVPVNGANPTFSQWIFGWNSGAAEGYPRSAGSAQILNDGGSSTGGVQNYARLTGPGAYCQQQLSIPGGQAFFVSFAARSNNPTLSVVSVFSPSGTGSGYTNGTYTGIALNGASGTGALATVTIQSNVVVDYHLTALGSGYMSGTSFTVPLTAGGGSGITLTVYTGAHALACGVWAYDANNNLVLVNGSNVNYFWIYNSVPAWQNPAASGTLLMPANVKYIVYQLITEFTEPFSGYWDVSLAVFQPVQQQQNTQIGQTNSQNPAAQTSAYSAVAVQAIASAAQATYGLRYATLEGSTSELVSMSTADPGGTAQITAEASGSGPYFQLSVSNTGGGSAILALTGAVSGYGLNFTITPSSFATILTLGGSSFTGATGTISYTKPGGSTGTITVKNGFITAWT